MASRFSDRILKVMHVSGYHAGDNILVEVDIGIPISYVSLLPIPSADPTPLRLLVDCSVG